MECSLQGTIHTAAAVLHTVTQGHSRSKSQCHLALANKSSSGY